MVHALVRSEWRSLHANLLNGQFSEVLETVQNIAPKSVDVAFLQLYLNLSCRAAHFPSVRHIWNKYMNRHKLLWVPRPRQLVLMSQLALRSNDMHLPDNIYRYYRKNYRHDPTCPEMYSLTQIVVESESARLLRLSNREPSVLFNQAWNKYLDLMQDINLPSSVADFPKLTRCMGLMPTAEITDFVLSAQSCTQRHSMILLLNIALLQSELDPSTKITLLKEMILRDPSADYSDSLTILLRDCDPARAVDLMEECEKLIPKSLKSKPKRIFKNCLKGSEYEFKLKKSSMESV